MPTHDERMRRETVAKWHGEVRQPTHNLRADRCASGPARVRVRVGRSRDGGQLYVRGPNRQHLPVSGNLKPWKEGWVYWGCPAGLAWGYAGGAHAAAPGHNAARGCAPHGGPQAHAAQPGLRPVAARLALPQLVWPRC